MNKVVNWVKSCQKLLDRGFKNQYDFNEIIAHPDFGFAVSTSFRGTSQSKMAPLSPQKKSKSGATHTRSSNQLKETKPKPVAVSKLVPQLPAGLLN